MRNDKENVIVTKSLQFAVEIVNFSEKLEGENKFVIERQLLNLVHQSGLMFAKLKMPREKQTLFINLRLLQRKPKKLIIGCFCANYLSHIPMKNNYIKTLWN